MLIKRNHLLEMKNDHCNFLCGNEDWAQKHLMNAIFLSWRQTLRGFTSEKNRKTSWGCIPIPPKKLNLKDEIFENSSTSWKWKDAIVYIFPPAPLAIMRFWVYLWASNQDKHKEWHSAQTVSRVILRVSRGPRGESGECLRHSHNLWGVLWTCRRQWGLSLQMAPVWACKYTWHQTAHGQKPSAGRRGWVIFVLPLKSACFSKPFHTPHQPPFSRVAEEQQDTPYLSFGGQGCTQGGGG